MELYHLLNRGIDKRTIFLDQQDYLRFIHDLYEFNDTKAAGSTYYTFGHHTLDFVSPDRRERIVDIHGWVLMKNHYHLLLSERVEGGITQFIRKLNIGYAKYFNEKYKRSGTLFQGRTKKILLERDAHFLYILHYLHLNPLDYRTETRTWRQGHIANTLRTLTYLYKYRWSSYLDYIGEKNFPSILTTSLFGDVFTDYKKELTNYVRDLGVETIPNLPLES